VTARRIRPAVAIEPRALDLATAAAVYAIGENTLRDLIEREGFPHLRVGNRVVIPVAQADAWLAARTTGAEVAS
jgi:excisionase family DNA binding protein